MRNKLLLTIKNTYFIKIVRLCRRAIAVKQHQLFLVE